MSNDNMLGLNLCESVQICIGMYSHIRQTSNFFFYLLETGHDRAMIAQSQES